MNRSLPRRIFFVFAFTVILAPLADAGIVLKDHISDSSSWDGIDALVEQGYSLSQPNGDIGVTTAFTGNGLVLKTVAGIFGHDSGFGVPNNGSPTNMNFRISFFDTSADYVSDPFGENAMLPNRMVILPKATNADWLTTVGTSDDGHSLFHWEFDIENLGISTTAGQQHLISIIPETNFQSGAAFIAYSRGGAGAIGSELDWGRSDISNLGPDTLQNIGAPYSHAAYRVTTVAIPEPSAFLYFGLLVVLCTLKRRAMKVSR